MSTWLRTHTTITGVKKDTILPFPGSPEQNGTEQDEGGGMSIFVCVSIRLENLFEFCFYDFVSPSGYYCVQRNIGHTFFKVILKWLVQTK